MTLYTPRRITSARPESWIMPVYATISPFNRDATRLILVHQDHFELYDGDGNWIRPLPLRADSEPRWCLDDSDALLYLSGTTLWRLDTRIAANPVKVRTWTQYQTLTGKGESDLSEDGDHLILMGDGSNGRNIFLYRISTDTMAVVPFSGHINSLMVTPDNNALMSGHDGTWLYNVRKNTIVKVAPTLAHQDVCRDQNGDEILVRINANDPWADLTPGCPNGIEKVHLATGVRTCLWPIGWNPLGGPQSRAAHISCPDQSGWALVSVYSPLNTEPSEVHKVFLDGSGHEWICDTESVMPPPPHDPYNAQPKASIDRRGHRFVFASNAGAAWHATPNGPNFCDTFLVVLTDSPPAPPPIVVPPATPGWKRIDFSQQKGRRWLFEVDHDGNLQMYDQE